MLFFFLVVRSDIDLFINKVCEFINTISCHSDLTIRSTLIFTPILISQGLLIRITTDENLRYIVLLNEQLIASFDIIIIHFRWWTYNKSVFVLLSVWVDRPTRDCSLIWRNHNCRSRAVNFDLCSAFMVIEQWGFSNAPHPLWHGSTLYNCQLCGLVTLTPVAKLFTV